MTDPAVEAVLTGRERWTVVRGDCREVMAGFPDGRIDMVLADLPYGTTYAPWDRVIPMPELWIEMLRVTKPKAALVFTCSQPFTSALVMSRPDLFRCEWIWDKVNGANFANANRQPLKVHESVLVFGTGQTTYNPQKRRGRPNHKQGHTRPNFSETRVIDGRVKEGLDGMKFPKSILTFPKHSSQSGLHSTQKPVELFEYLIRTYSNEGETILDPTTGSGTTGEAALRCGRRAILIDNDVGCVETVRRRMLAIGSQRTLTQ